MLRETKRQTNLFHKMIIAIFMMVISILIIFIIEKVIPIENYYYKRYTDKPIVKDGFFFDTYVSITIYDSKENYSNIIKSMKDMEALLDRCMAMCSDFEKIFSRTNEESELYKLNHNQAFFKGHAVSISNELSECIQQTLTYSKHFGNKYSILSGKLCDIWDYNNSSIPKSDDITNCVNSIYDSYVIVDNNKIKIETNNSASSLLEINLGSTAKGYIADKISTYLIENNIKYAIIDLGGNIVVIGDKYDHSSYKIGIKKPFSEDTSPYAVCKVSDKSVVTSGIYERYFKVNEMIYHHIIDCQTGYPADNDVLSVTVISDSSLLADCFSTGCLLIGSDETLKLINSLKEVECIIIDKNYQIILSDGLMYENDYIVIR